MRRLIEAIAKTEFARARLLQPEQHAQQSALAAAAAPDDGDEFTGADVQIDAPQYLIFSKRLAQLANCHRDAAGRDGPIRPASGVNSTTIVGAAERLDVHILTSLGP